jgi:hypothetical protein
VKVGLASSSSFAGWLPGWECPEGSSFPGFLVFWLENAGVFGVLSLVAFVLAPARERSLVAPFAVLFVLANLGRIQPWSHDNVKLFAWVWLAFTPLVAGVLARLWAADLAGKALATQAFLLCIATGVCAVQRECDSRLEVRMFDAPSIAFADVVREKTAPGAIVLTSSQHNHPVPVLAGRTIVLGFKGWLWPHGVPYRADEGSTREADVTAIYEGDARARALLDRYAVDWVCVGPEERSEFSHLDEAAIRRLAIGPALVSGEHRLYRVR